MAPQLVAKYGRRPLKQTNAHHPAQSQNPRRSAANNPCPDSRQRNRRGVDTSVVRHPQREDRPAFHKRRSNGRQLCHPSNPTLYPSHTDRRSTKNTKVTETNTKNNRRNSAGNTRCIDHRQQNRRRSERPQQENRPGFHQRRSYTNRRSPKAAKTITKKYATVTRSPPKNRRPNKKVEAKPTAEDLDRDLEAYMKGPISA
uniref:Gag-pol polyprotein n=1 Tax=Panagrellus redivivus TaxID=6233 RepID=A0A7E4VE14_PANRE